MPAEDTSSLSSAFWLALVEIIQCKNLLDETALEKFAAAVLLHVIDFCKNNQL